MGNHVEQSWRTVGVAPVIGSKPVEVLHQVFVAHNGTVFAVHGLKQVQFGRVKQSFERLEINVIFNFVQALFDEQRRGGVVAKGGFVELFFQGQSLRFSGDAFQGCGKIAPRFVGLKAGAVFVKVVTDGIERLVVEMGFGVFVTQGE